MAKSYKRNIEVKYSVEGVETTLTGSQASQFINQFEAGEQIINVFDPETNTYTSVNRDCVCSASKTYSNGDEYVPVCDEPLFCPAPEPDPEP